MDWQMVGALAELLGALGVIATLGYLAVQIRRSTRVAQHRAAAELLAQTQSFLAQISKDTESAALYRRGMAADSDLTEDEVVRFHAQVLELALMWQRGFHMSEASDLESWMMTTLSTGRSHMVTAPGFRRWFEVRGSWLTPEFRQVLEREMRGAGVYRAAGIESRAQVADGS